MNTSTSNEPHLISEAGSPLDFSCCRYSFTIFSYIKQQNLIFPNYFLVQIESKNKFIDSGSICVIPMRGSNDVFQFAFIIYCLGLNLFRDFIDRIQLSFTFYLKKKNLKRIKTCNERKLNDSYHRIECHIFGFTQSVCCVYHQYLLCWSTLFIETNVWTKQYEIIQGGVDSDHQ